MKFEYNEMGSKYKSPLIRSRTTSVTQTVATPPDRSSTNEQTPFSGSDVLVYDNTPRPSPVVQHWRGRGCSSPRFDSPRPSRGSPYQWTPPSQTGGFYENSWSSQVTYTLFSFCTTNHNFFLFVFF